MIDTKYSKYIKHKPFDEDTPYAIMTKFSQIFKGFKLVTFSILLTIVIFMYGIDTYKKFWNDSATFVSTTEETEDFNMPPLTICMDNGLKPTILKKYGMTSTFEFVYPSLILDLEKIQRTWDTFVEASYIIDKAQPVKIS